jgi:hypothetical protein
MTALLSKTFTGSDNEVNVFKAFFPNKFKPKKYFFITLSISN